MNTLSTGANKSVEDEEALLSRDQNTPASPLTIASTSSSSINTRRAKGRPINRLRLDNISNPSTEASLPSKYVFNPFFSNIQQNRRLDYVSAQDRFSIRPPRYLIRYQPETRSINYICNQDEPHIQRIRTDAIDTYALPTWMRRALSPEDGPKYMADCYEAIEKAEQNRLESVMAHHSKVRGNFTDHPFSMVASLEKGSLNRYSNIWPFEYNRVKLHTDSSLSNSYINASLIQYNTTSVVPSLSEADQVPILQNLNDQSDRCRSNHSYRKYISTQGPLPSTFKDFWSIVWDQGSRVIVMLTKEEEMNRIKCHQYWPSDIGNTLVYGTIQVTLLSKVYQAPESFTEEESSILSEYVIIREFEIRNNCQSSRKIHHIQYREWHDFGVPDNPLGALNLILLANTTQVEYENSQAEVGPMIVHCSAGCGRTGAFCTIDTIVSRLSHIDQASDESLDLVYQTVAKFREQRVSMVQTLRQYVFCYEAILWWMLAQS